MQCAAYGHWSSRAWERAGVARRGGVAGAWPVWDIARKEINWDTKYVIVTDLHLLNPINFIYEILFGILNLFSTI